MLSLSPYSPPPFSPSLRRCRQEEARAADFNLNTALSHIHTPFGMATIHRAQSAPGTDHRPSGAHPALPVCERVQGKHFLNQSINISPLIVLLEHLSFYLFPPQDKNEIKTHRTYAHTGKPTIIPPSLSCRDIKRNCDKAAEM